MDKSETCLRRQVTKQWPTTAAHHCRWSPHWKPPALILLTLLWVQRLPVPAECDYSAHNTQAHPQSYTIGHYKMPIYISYAPVWISLGHTATNGGDAVKVFMPCNPTVYLLVIQGNEGKHILRPRSHLLSGWIHSFSKMPSGNNKSIMRGRGGICVRYCGSVHGVGKWVFVRASSTDFVEWNWTCEFISVCFVQSGLIKTSKHVCLFLSVLCVVLKTDQ